MATYPKAFAAIIDAAVRKHKSNVDAAVDKAVADLENEPGFAAWRDQMVRDHVSCMVHHRRNALNSPRNERPSRTGDKRPAIARREINLPDVSSKIAEQITLDYMIAGKTLGTLYGRDLIGLAESAWSSGQRSLLFSHVFAHLSRIVPRDKQVKDVVSASKLSSIASQVASGSILLPPVGGLGEEAA